MSEPSEAPKSPPRSTGKRLMKLGGLLLLVGAVALTFLLFDVTQLLKALLEWTRGLGGWGAVALAAVYAVTTVLFVPGTILTLAAGTVFGLWTGSAAVIAGSNLGAWGAFWVARTVGRDWVSSKVLRNPKFQAVDEAVGEKGFKIVLLTRLSPVFPFNLLNYAFGVTRVGFPSYALATFIGMLPGTFMYVYLGTTFRRLAELFSGDREKSPGEYVLWGIGLLATIVVTVYVTRIARRAMNEKVQLSGSEETAPRGSPARG